MSGIDFEFGDGDEGFVPGRFAEDAQVGLLLLSGAMIMASAVAFLLDGWESALVLAMQSVWLELMYVALTERARRPRAGAGAGAGAAAASGRGGGRR